MRTILHPLPIVTLAAQNASILDDPIREDVRIDDPRFLHV
jgi:hypothetical protein